MRTTINAVDRRGDAHSIERLEAVLIDARRLLADTRAALELQIERLKDGPLDDDAQAQLKGFETLLAQARKATTSVIDLEAKVCVHSLSLGPPLDLEAARYEILSRLARLDS